MSSAHCVLRSYPTAGWWRIECACGQVIRGVDAIAAREKYVEHKAKERVS